ncbi:thioesterase domain-containing protein [Colletotrichum plurivorum]|uniref:Thioesterase domain-containing protein n=1 Tax=Colletotrichum plurivorum TaxID=2175906 RepID=A0A8H6KMW9_9PEZI|nr:thioesterase domain-containing protein [Colletotrichum plurivorum]
MNERNPLQVQFAPPNQRQRKLPLVLIHDGGGTSFAYFLLESLHRDVWAIHNPHYHTGEAWPGGMVQMARHYIGLMLMAGITGPVILGGWSLGGLLSLTISQILAKRPRSRLSIAGLLLVDSPYHTPWSELALPTSEPDLGDVPDLVRRCFANCDRLLGGWKLLPWDGDALDGADVSVAVGGDKFRLRRGQVLLKGVDSGAGGWRTVETRRSEAAVRAPPSPPPSPPQQLQQQQLVTPPPGVLVKCVQWCPGREGAEHPCQVDLDRDETVLGWESGDHVEFIKAVIEADAHHYNVFDLSKISQVTKHINDGLEILESIHASEPSKYS